MNKERLTVGARIACGMLATVWCLLAAGFTRFGLFYPFAAFLAMFGLAHAVTAMYGRVHVSRWMVVLGIVANLLVACVIALVVVVLGTWFSTQPDPNTQLLPFI